MTPSRLVSPLPILGLSTQTLISNHKHPQGDVPGGPVAKTLPSQGRRSSSTLGQGTSSHIPALKNLHTTTKDPHAPMKISCATTKSWRS